MTLKELIKNIETKKRTLTQLKASLAKRELIAYNDWKVLNPKDRTAMEKVIANIKIDDENWVKEEEAFEKLKVDVEILGYKKSIAQEMLHSSFFSKEDVEEFLKDE